MACHLHVVLPTEHELHWTPRVECGHGGGAMQELPPRLLATKTSPKPFGLADELVLRNAQHTSNDLLMLRNVLQQVVGGCNLPGTDIVGADRVKSMAEC